MITAKAHLRLIILLTFCLLPLGMQAQEFVHVMHDTLVCTSDSVYISGGLNLGHEVVVQGGEATRSVSERVFLPDGKPCGTMGCSYRASVTFSGFGVNDIIESVEDIEFLRINIEHSYIGDIYINVTCPNTQKATIMRFGGSTTSSCHTAIPTTDRGWLSGSNVSGGTYFGLPVDSEDSSFPCDETRYSNRPGTGWNYCWSNNTTSGYQYASGDGIIYRSGHASNGSSIDSSNVAAGTRFYHPDQSFQNLVGCPLNGEWYVEVIDGFGVDNGYIFGWELALSEEKLRAASGIDSLSTSCNSIVHIDDSSFYAVRPDGDYADTTVTYPIAVHFHGGTVIDTTVSVTFHAPEHTLLVTNLCQGRLYTFRDTIDITSDTSIFDYFTDRYGCDSIIENRFIHYYIPEYTLLSDTLCVGKPYTFRDTITILSDTSIFDTLTNYYGCDSIVENEFIFHYRPLYTLVTDTLCFNREYTFRDSIPILADTSIFDTLATIHGCDSIVENKFIFVDGIIPHILMSLDNVHWHEDTLIMGCKPMRLFLRDSVSGPDPLGVRHWNLGDSTLIDDTVHLPDTFLAPSTFSHIYDTLGIFSISLDVKGVSGCHNGKTLDSIIWVFDAPEAAFFWNPEEMAISNAETQFTNLSTPEGLCYNWLIETTPGGEKDSLNEVSPFYCWGEPNEVKAGDYNVDLIAIWTHMGPDSVLWECRDTATHTVTIINDWLQFPNLVTPNNDGVNDTWVVKNLVEFQLYSMNEVWIYDAWGALVFHTRNIRSMDDFWDPAATGAPDGTYYYRFMAQGEYGLVKRNGLIEVVR
ncbi:MAG: gliding motility-associated C-terminal domain-containing protein [Bacteroidales bacterium]|nr:gliding motility-associated C-terminal domain-containing protein [Bacteroidales bacterium]